MKRAYGEQLLRRSPRNRKQPKLLQDEEALHMTSFLPRQLVCLTQQYASRSRLAVVVYLSYKERQGFIFDSWKSAPTKIVVKVERGHVLCSVFGLEQKLFAVVNTKRAKLSKDNVHVQYADTTAKLVKLSPMTRLWYISSRGAFLANNQQLLRFDGTNTEVVVQFPKEWLEFVIEALSVRGTQVFVAGRKRFDERLLFVIDLCAVVERFVSCPIPWGYLPRVEHIIPCPQNTLVLVQYMMDYGEDKGGMKLRCELLAVNLETMNIDPLNHPGLADPQNKLSHFVTVDCGEAFFVFAKGTWALDLETLSWREQADLAFGVVPTLVHRLHMVAKIHYHSVQ
jgi:hypothetical protein